MRQEVFELHALLKAIKLPGPFVLVGHSIGGLLVRLYTQQYGSDVVGLVLVDPTHENAMMDSEAGAPRSYELRFLAVDVVGKHGGRIPW
jgi:pimeloyl-ACP methyl ester carboxylesterase